MGGYGPGCPLSRPCCVTPQTHHPPTRARFTGEFRPKVKRLQVDGDMVPPDPGRSSFASCQLAEYNYAGQTTLLLGSFELAFGNSNGH